MYKPLPTFFQRGFFFIIYPPNLNFNDEFTVDGVNFPEGVDGDVQDDGERSLRQGSLRW